MAGFARRLKREPTTTLFFLSERSRAQTRLSSRCAVAQTTTSPSSAGRPTWFGAAAEEEANRVERAVRDYVAAISDRDGEVLCELVHGIADLDLPVRRGNCAGSVSESIGYRDPRGYPVFEKAVVTGAPDLKIDHRDARATATVVTDFADRKEASVEDDVIYLVRGGGEWLIAKPSSTLYRAIGIADVPPSVLTPPPG